MRKIFSILVILFTHVLIASENEQIINVQIDHCIDYDEKLNRPSIKRDSQGFKLSYVAVVYNGEKLVDPRLVRVANSLLLLWKTKQTQENASACQGKIIIN